MADEETPLLRGDKKADKDDPLQPPHTDALNKKDMTLSRRLARCLSQYEWYNPKGVANDIDKAWDYFENFTLARYQFRDTSSSSRKGKRQSFLHKADVGEKDPNNPTRLYPVLKTSEIDLGDFGVGVGIYFFTLRCLSIIMFIAGLINLPNLIYYASDDYEAERDHKSAFWAFESSAICTHQSWVPCPTCTKEQWSTFPSTFSRYGQAEAGNGSILTFIKRNHCSVTGRVGMVGYLSVVFICLSIAFLQRFIKWRERYLDLAAQTASDYTIAVENPPKEARDVHEWKNFFEERFGPVTCVTVALDNEELIRALIKRRQLVYTLETLQPPDVQVDPHDIATAAASVPEMSRWQKLLFGNAQKIEQQIAELDDKIATDLSKGPHPVSEVFVTFEAELSQKRAFLEMKVAGIDVLNNNKEAIDSQYLFQESVLAISEPPEPSSVRWEDLDESRITRMKQQLVTSLLTTVVIVGGCALITYASYRFGSMYAAIMVTVTNSIAPVICSFITEYESHPSEGAKQASLYHKITACIWIFTAIITAIITPFADTLQNEKDSLIPAMFAIFITEMLKAPVKQVLDLPGHIKRHIIGPRARDQKRMNKWFQGTSYLLSERYTDMTNVLFLTFYYALIFPAGFFFGAATLYVHYWADKFCLLRNWAPAPLLNSKIADLSRDYFFTAAVAVYAIISAFNYASFPYDKACEDTDSTVSSNYVGTFNGVDGSGDAFDATISEGDKNWYYCDQDLIRYWPPAFLAVLKPHKEHGAPWMTDEQHKVSWIYGWTSFGVCIALVIILFDIYRRHLRSLLFATNQGDERKAFFNKAVSEVHMNFSLVPSISAYVPQAKVAGHSYPVLLCPVNGKIDTELIGWDAPGKNYDLHNAIFDVPHLAEKEGIFSIVQHWPVTQTETIPAEAKQEEERNERPSLVEAVEGSVRRLMSWLYK